MVIMVTMMIRFSKWFSLFLTALALIWLPDIASADTTAAAGDSIQEHLASDSTVLISSLDDNHLIQLSRSLIKKGRCDAALDILNLYFKREDRHPDLDWEASVLKDTCCPAATSPEKQKPSLQVNLVSAERREQTPKINAIQIFVFTTPDLERLGDELDILQQQGIDTLIVRAFQNTGDRPLIHQFDVEEPGVYFRTNVAPVAADVMPGIVKMAHARGMNVFAWMTTRKNDWLIIQHPEWLEYQYDFELGKSIPSRSLSIFQGGVREKMKTLFRDLAATGIDGILFQDDLVMRYNEGFSSLARQLFLMETGRGIHPDDLFIRTAFSAKMSGYRPLFASWSQWKSKALLSFLDELVQEARSVNPDLLIAANVYYESILKPENGLAWYAQDVRELLKHGVDFLAYMSYHRQMKSELSLNDSQLNTLLDEVVQRSRELDIDESRIIFKIQTTDWERIEAIPTKEWEAIRDFFREAGNFSIALLQS